MAGDPARDPDADRRQLLVARPRRRSGPATRRAVDAVVGRRANQHFFEIADVAVHVAAIGLQVDDRIADELAGP